MAGPAGAQLVNPNTNAAGLPAALDSEHNVGGGRYLLIAVASNWNAGTVSLQMLGPDGATWVDCGSNTTLTANGNGYADIGTGRVRLHLSSGSAPTGLYAAISRVIT